MPEEYDINQMREDAARRAREMQARARGRSQPGRRPDNRSPSPRSPEPPAPVPEPPVPQRQEPPLSAENPPESALTALFKDKDRTIILALLLLLEGDGNHHELMFALMFLLL